MQDRKMGTGKYRSGKCRTKNGGVGNAGPENAGEISHRDLNWKKTKKCAVHCCITFILSYAGMYWLFRHCCSYFRIRLIHYLLHHWSTRLLRMRRCKTYFLYSRSGIFQVVHFPVLHFWSLKLDIIGPAFSGPAFSGPAFSGPAFQRPRIAYWTVDKRWPGKAERMRVVTVVCTTITKKVIILQGITLKIQGKKVSYRTGWQRP